MRTLKKTLALVLVLCMVLSCGVFASADFTDAEEIVNTEAVDLLVGLGVVNGYKDGSFNPEGTLTRAEACVIITRLHNATDLAGTAPFTDLAGYAWAEDAIAYCYAEGIIAGNGDGTFAPGATLTGSAWAKMLLCALGYDATATDMTGESWEIGVAKLAKSVKLFEGTVADQSASVSRDVACAWTYNALQTETVYYVGGSNITIGDVAISNNSTLCYNEITLGEEQFGLTWTAKADAYGRTYYAWTNGLEGKKEVVYSTIEVAPVLTYTSAVTNDMLVKALGKDADVDIDLTKTGAGVLTEIYALADGTYAALYVDTYVWTLSKADIVAANAKKEIKAGILLGDDNLKWETEEEYAEGDVVLYTLGTDGKVASAELAPYITGAITATAASYVRVNGEKMTLSKNHDSLKYGADELAYVDGEAEVVIYTDNYGYIIETGTIENAPVAVETDYVYVIEYQAIGAKSGSSDLFGETAGEAAAAKAMVLDLESGEVKVVDLAVVVDEEGDYVYATKAGEASTTVVKTGAAELNEVYEYAVLEDGSYALTGDAVDLGTVTVKKGVASVADKTATSKTVLKVVEWNVDKKGNITGATITETTGIANFPKDGKTYTGSAIVSTDKSGTIVTEILVVMQKVVAPVVTPATYAVYLGEGEKTDAQAYAFIVDGEVTNYVCATGYSFEAKVGALVTIELTNGKLSKVASTTAKAINEISYIDETFVIVDGAVYYFAEEYTVVNATADYAVDSIAVEDYVALYVNADGEVEFIVIDEAPEAE